jgi:hypothetical protein
MTMAKQRPLPTRAFGAEPAVPGIPSLAVWVAEHRGTAADLTSYRLDQSLAPQIDAQVTMPCAGGIFMKDRVMGCLTGVADGRATGEIGVLTEAVIDDTFGLMAQKKSVWCALPAPHTLGITDAYYHDEDEWSSAITGAYRTLMRSMRDAGIGGHVLICDRIGDAEVSVLARQKVFFFQPEQDLESLETLLGHQRQVAVGKKYLDAVFDLANEYELHQVIVVDADDESIAVSLSHLDPDQVIVGGYCKDSCDQYWKDLAERAFYTL